MFNNATTSLCLGRTLRVLAAAIAALSVETLVVAEVDRSNLPPPATQKIEFTRDIRPLFVEHCHRCHGAEKQEGALRLDLKPAALKGGDSGPVIVPRDSANSRLIHLVAGLDKNLVMPKKGERLTPQQIGLLRAWIDQGADWPASFTEPKQKDKADWWAFKPAQRPQLPATQNASRLPHPIDDFIRARLAAEKLEPSPEADRVTLIRRLSFDLIGLPPSPEEVAAFVADRAPDAYGKLVDRLLASPRHGERWARHWLDAMHYGETHGYDKDKLRPHAWPYRDYVIRAFNDDKPYARFVEEQLAGDVLHPDEPEGIVALGFIAAGPWDFVGHVELPITKTDGLIARYNDRDDMVMTAMSTFQSFTVHCARCHDHKFDPISQKDYYSLQAVFAGVDRANRPYDTDRETHRKRGALLVEKAKLEKRQGQLKALLAKVTGPELVRIDQRLATVQAQLDSDAPEAGRKSPSNGYHSGIESKPDTLKWVQVDLGRRFDLDEIRLVPARPTDFPDTPGFGFPVRFKVEISEDESFTETAIVSDHSTNDFKNPGDLPVPFTAPGETPFRGRYLRVTATRLWERTRDHVFALGEIQAFAAGTNAARGAAVTALDSIEAGRWSRKFLVDGFSSRAQLDNSAPTPEQLAARRRTAMELKQLENERARIFDSLVDPELKSEQVEVEARRNVVEQELKALPAPKLVYAAASDFKPEGAFQPPNGPRPVHLLARGEVKRAKELVLPAALASVPGPKATFDLSDPNDEGSRRAAFAKWLTDPRNLQTRRSIVNRVWQHHFGRGLVETANDFGHMGGEPSHPELLDWLAFWFLDHGESLKALHRLIVTSATYRQVSQHSLISESVVGSVGRERRPSTGPSESSERARQADADNRLLWRMNRARLDAECIRDAMLAVSGHLDLTMGGPSDRQFHFKDDHSPVYDYTRFDVDAKEGRRRSIYRHIVRSVADPFMDCLDAADPSQLVARRNTTLTALQALATLNNPFVLKQCEHFAERLRKLAPDTGGQIDAAYRLALSRAPTADERQRLITYADKHGLPNACRVLFNSTEFMFVD